MTIVATDLVQRITDAVCSTTPPTTPHRGLTKHTDVELCVVPEHLRPIMGLAVDRLFDTSEDSGDIEEDTRKFAGRKKEVAWLNNLFYHSLAKHLDSIPPKCDRLEVDHEWKVWAVFADKSDSEMCGTSQMFACKLR